MPHVSEFRCGGGQLDQPRLRTGQFCGRIHRYLGDWLVWGLHQNINGVQKNLFQTIALAAGATYEVNFLAGNRPGYGPNEFLTVYLDDTVIVPQYATPDSLRTGRKTSSSFTVSHTDSCNATVNVTLEFRCTAADATGFATKTVFLDDVHIVKLSSECVCKCAVGYYGEGINGNMTAGCNACLAGTFANEAGLPECLSCPPGKYLDVAGGSVCLECAAGTFQNASGASTCVACGNGSSSAIVGSIVATD
eukprot:1386699-Rhodomonas_salina.1